MKKEDVLKLPAREFAQRGIASMSAGKMTPDQFSKLLIEYMAQDRIPAREVDPLEILGGTVIE